MAEIKIIQFINPDVNLLIRGTSTTSVYGQTLEVGPGKPGHMFRYMSPEEQVDAYKAQVYMLVGIYDTDNPKKRIDHPDLDRRLDGGGPIPYEKAMSQSSGYHKELNKSAVSVGHSSEEEEEDDDTGGGSLFDDGTTEEDEEEASPKKKAKSSKSSDKASKKTTTKKSSSRKSSDKKSGKASKSKK